MERMRDFTRRPLTAGEIALGRSLFADAVAWERIGVVQAPKVAGFGAMAPNGCMIVFAAWRAALDFARCGIEEQGWFAHELAHLWQAARGVHLPLAKLRALGRAAYRADWSADRPFEAFNIEQQAEIVRFAFLARCGRPDPTGPDVRRLAALWAPQSMADA